jgi:hypothetical protein
LSRASHDSAHPAIDLRPRPEQRWRPKSRPAAAFVVKCPGYLLAQDRLRRLGV